MSARKSVAILILVVIVVLALLYLVDANTDYLNLGLETTVSDLIDKIKNYAEDYSESLTIKAVVGSFILLIVALASIRFYYKSSQ